MFVDALQYVNPSRHVFEQMRQGQLDLVHITVGYHEDYDGVLRNIGAWHRHLERNADILAPAHTTNDVALAKAAGKTAIMFGLQNPLAFSCDLSRVQILRQLGILFCQMTYNQQSLLGAGCFEDRDSGVTAFGKECIAEMNRLGMIIDLSHAGPTTALETAQLSRRAVAVTHANPRAWRDVPRNISDELISVVTQKGGMIGFSLYPHHLKDGSDCSLNSLATMAADCVKRFGPHFGVGSDLCQDQPDDVVNWMRNGHWRKTPVPKAAFPDQPDWFRDNRDFPGLAHGFAATELTDADVAGLMGRNWIRFLEKGLRPE